VQDVLNELTERSKTSETQMSEKDVEMPVFSEGHAFARHNDTQKILFLCVVDRAF